MDEEYWAIIKDVGAGERGRAYTLAPGRRYKTHSGARRGFKRMEEDWDNLARSGLIFSPSWAGKFKEHHILVHVPEGKTLKEVVDSMPGIFYMGLAL